MKNYQCEKCGLHVESHRRPSSFGCTKGGLHQWQDLGHRGADVYQCTKCGLTLHSEKRPSSFGCPSKGMHQWNKLSR